MRSRSSRSSYDRREYIVSPSASTGSPNSRSATGSLSAANLRAVPNASRSPFSSILSRALIAASFAFVLDRFVPRTESIILLTAFTVLSHTPIFFSFDLNDGFDSSATNSYSFFAPYASPSLSRDWRYTSRRSDVASRSLALTRPTSDSACPPSVIDKAYDVTECMASCRILSAFAWSFTSPLAKYSES